MMFLASLQFKGQQTAAVIASHSPRPHRFFLKGLAELSVWNCPRGRGSHCCYNPVSSSVQKLEDSLRHVDGFDTQAFQVKVSSVSKELQHFIEKLGHDGTLQKCTEMPTSFNTPPEMEASKAQMNDYIASFSEECRRWDRLLLNYQNRVQELSRWMNCRSQSTYCTRLWMRFLSA
ncbi:kinetochore-associated protein DSN1 homolog [Rhinatrema bivittatum]|uniref:kinetochore-associated protein DSN1 homolog n=1 Tax=Rhinatrema bivittatum TaxID=194408 RepID=UPI00112DA85E|nr:kinetochore-associated protein DSN1 homolog [Rhinatrema bivittatum]